MKFQIIYQSQIKLPNQFFVVVGKRCYACSNPETWEIIILHVRKHLNSRKQNTPPKVLVFNSKKGIPKFLEFQTLELTLELEVLDEQIYSLVYLTKT